MNENRQQYTCPPRSRKGNRKPRRRACDSCYSSLTSNLGFGRSNVMQFSLSAIGASIIISLAPTIDSEDR
ncbi:hypothetical protein N7499_004264 [Penicillium canescens]|nr:hypothetical protein N7499_004264 [Penicillium canescens]